MNAQTALMLAELIALRADREHRCGTHPDSVAAALTAAGTDEEIAGAIAWGTADDVAARDLDRIALDLRISPQLLALIVHPASADVVDRMLTDVVRETDEDCGDCNELRDRLEFWLANAVDGTPFETLEEILFDLAAHLIVLPGGILDESDDDLEHYPGELAWDEEPDEEDLLVGGEIGRMIHAFATLPPLLRSQLLRALEQEGAELARLSAAFTELPATLKARVVEEIESATAELELDAAPEDVS